MSEQVGNPNCWFFSCEGPFVLVQYPSLKGDVMSLCQNILGEVIRLTNYDNTMVFRHLT